MIGISNLKSRIRIITKVINITIRKLNPTKIIAIIFFKIMEVKWISKEITVAIAIIITLTITIVVTIITKIEEWLNRMVKIIMRVGLLRMKD